MTIAERMARTVWILVLRHHYNWAVGLQELDAMARWVMADKKVEEEAVE